MSVGIAIIICFGIVVLAALIANTVERYWQHKEEMANIYKDHKK